MIRENDTYAGPETITLGQIETLCRELAKEDSAMRTLVEELETDLAVVKANHLPHLKRQAAAVARREADLYSLIERAPHLFVKPRTITLHGIKVGFTVVEGKLVWKCDDEMLVARIRDRYGKLADDFLNTKVTPDKDALRALDATSQAKLGCAIEGAGDAVVLKRTEGEIEKLINKLTEKLVEVLTQAE